MERSDDGRLVQNAFCAVARVHIVKVEPLLKRVEIVKDVRKDKVEQRPELGEVVLFVRIVENRMLGLACKGVPVRIILFALVYDLSSWINLRSALY